MTVTIATLGFPRIGPRRELKFALENHWSGKASESELLDAAAGLRAAAWARQKGLGVDWLPSNDFSLYDHVLDMSLMLGAIPKRYGAGDGEATLATYFAMARGTTGEAGCGHAHGGSLTACEMTKWFDTNYHYMVPELAPDTRLALNRLKVVDEYREAKALGYETRPVLVGPVTWLSLAKGRDGADPFDKLDEVLGLYAAILGHLVLAGAEWVQIDEPILATDLSEVQRRAFTRAYARLARSGVKLMLASYFGGLGDNLGLAAGLPVAGLHVDLVRAPEQLDAVLKQVPRDVLLSLGVIDGRNVWRADLDAVLARVAPVAAVRDVVLAPSCSLLHVPVDLALDSRIDGEVKQWLAFATQKIEELAILKAALEQGRDAVAEPLAGARAAATERVRSRRIHDPVVAARMASVTPAMRERGPYAKRAAAQAAELALPAFPTTTIGSFPQTAEVRKARAAHNRGEMDGTAYATFLREETERAIRWQEAVGLDMLVHGEFERNDMVQYFGEQLAGFAFTVNGWVQSYGSRCVRPPILYGDVSRPAPMTVEWWRHAQGLTDRPVKGMLTGPVTILNWSFVRDDQPREASCRQIALAIRDEVRDLEAAGCKAIQIDEAALREGLPLRRRDWQQYLDWAVDCFRLSAAGVADATQIHTHMCYSEFNDILASIGAMDADVISIETARSQMELLEGFARYRYPAAIGPGVYDIHAPRVPGEDEMVALMRLAQTHLAPGQLWVNPDCGLKTRRWEEVRPAIEAMVAAARMLRADLMVEA